MATSELRNEGLAGFMAALGATLVEVDSLPLQARTSRRIVNLLENHVARLIASEEALTVADESAIRQLCRQLERAMDLHRNQP